MALPVSERAQKTLETACSGNRVRSGLGYAGEGLYNKKRGSFQTTSFAVLIINIMNGVL